jgi:hypothetical protein
MAPVLFVFALEYAIKGVWGLVVVEALHYKPEGREFDSGWCLWNFSLMKSIQPHCGPGVDSASNRIEYHKCFLGDKYVGLATLPP